MGHHWFLIIGVSFLLILPVAAVIVDIGVRRHMRQWRMNGRVNREDPCTHCGLRVTSEGHDGCLGTLPGVANACCGHGRPDEAYVQFTDGTDIRGGEAIDWFEGENTSGERADRMRSSLRKALEADDE